MGQPEDTPLRSSLASSGLRLLFVTIAVVCLTVLLFSFEEIDWRHLSRSEMRLFQRAVGGLGMGAAATPAWNLLHYDPRLQPVDDSNLWPVAGGYPYSPSAVSTAIGIRELPREELRIIRVVQ
jgi:hypothetical protein